MKPPFEGHKFNDDLLLAPADQDLAARKYPAIWHVLNHPEMRDLFSAYDEPANLAKSRARKAGFLAIGLVWIALVIASSEHLLAKNECLAWTLAAISALCGLIGVVIGGTGILFAARKRQWLRKRLMTERIRQFHFQTFVLRLPEILQSLGGGEARDAFLLERNLWFDGFQAKFDGKLDEQFTRTLGDEMRNDAWVHEMGREPGEVSEHPGLEPLFQAYRELRIMHQIGYANHQLQDDRRIFSPAPRRQVAVFSGVSFVCVILICAIHVGVLAGVLSQWPMWEVHAGIASVIIIWIAIVALAVRAIQDGLQPEREVERYQQYRSSVSFVLERFDRAASQKEKLHIMQEMERLVYDEMRDFLITGSRSQFVL